MADLTVFEQYCTLVDMLIEQSTKEELADSARLLALNIAHYHTRHGEIPLDKTLAMLHGVELNNEQLELAVKGMENLLGVLGNANSGLEETEH